MTMKARDIREQLALSRQEWARALNVNERTVVRWEDEGVDPGGTAMAIMMGIENAIADGVDPRRAGRLISLGIGSMIYYRLAEREKGR